MSTQAVFTIDHPRVPDVDRRGNRWRLQSEGIPLDLSNLDKVFWPGEGVTKGDLIAYYFNVSHWIIPHLAGRPLTMKRMPDGIEGDFFYQKNAPDQASRWVPRCSIEPEDGDVDDMVMVERPAHLLYVANLGAIEMHPMHGTCERYDLPDYMVFDLDPFEPAGFDETLLVARQVKVALDHLELAGYPKTSGATGLQIYVPVARTHTYEETRGLAEKIGRTIVRSAPALTTMEWAVSERTGKVFIDHNMNRRGASLASAYSVRPRLGAPVSAPLTWEEVLGGNVRPEQFSIRTIFDRLEEKGDLFAPVISRRQDLSPALAELGVERIGDRAGQGRLRRRIPPLGYPG